MNDPGWWATAKPVLEGLGIIISLALGFANLGWLIVQARRSAVTHRVALEAHGWANERRERELASSRAADEKRTWCAEMRRRVEESREPIPIPEGVDTQWVIDGENEGYFRQIRHPDGQMQLFRVRR